MKEEIKYDFNDILIKPNKQGLNSRKQVKPYYYDDMLPIMAAPMDTVVSLENAEIFLKHKITPIIPRNYTNVNNFNLPFSDKTWFAYGLEEFDETFLNELEPFNIETKINVLIDVANGHMPGIYERVVKTKEIYGDKLVLMVGNIANPETYRLLSDAGADYVRISIGNGNACFVENTMIKTIDGGKEIQNIEVNDLVLTHTGEYKEVINVTQHNTSENLIKINNTISTLDHKYYVLNKKFKDIVNDENIHEYTEWISAEKLNNEYFLLENV